MLAKPDDINAELIGQHRLIDDVADDLRLRFQLAIGAGQATSPKVSRPSSIDCGMEKPCNLLSMIACGEPVSTLPGSCSPI